MQLRVGNIGKVGMSDLQNKSCISSSASWQQQRPACQPPASPLPPPSPPFPYATNPPDTGSGKNSNFPPSNRPGPDAGFELVGGGAPGHPHEAAVLNPQPCPPLHRLIACAHACIVVGREVGESRRTPTNPTPCRLLGWQAGRFTHTSIWLSDCPCVCSFCQHCVRGP